MGRTPNKSQHRKLTLDRKILPPLLPGFELATLRSRIRRSTKKLSWLPFQFSGLEVFNAAFELTMNGGWGVHSLKLSFKRRANSVHPC